MNTPLKLALFADASHVNTQQWIESLVHAGCDVHLISFSQPLPSLACESYQLSLPTFLRTSKLKKLRYFWAIPEARQLIRTLHPDLVLAYYVTGYGTLASFLDFHPLVQITSGTDILLAPKKAPFNYIVHRNLNKAELITAWSPHMAKAAYQAGCHHDRVFVLPRGIPYARFASSRAEYPTSNPNLRVIVTRSLKPYYNHKVLIDSIGVLAQQHCQYQLTIAGQGPLYGQLLNQSIGNGTRDNITFSGFIPNESLPILLSKHNIYIAAAPSDGVSASLLEAMAVGLLPIVHDNPANRYWIESGSNGILLDSITVECIVNALTEALSNVELRRRAWEMNPKIVEANADMYKNSLIYVNRLEEIVHGA